MSFLCEECAERPAVRWAHHIEHGEVLLCSDCTHPDHEKIKYFSEAPLSDEQTLTGNNQYRPEDAQGVGAICKHEWIWHATGAGCGHYCHKCGSFMPHESN